MNYKNKYGILILGLTLVSNTFGMSKNMRRATNAIKASNYNFFYKALSNYKLNIQELNHLKDLSNKQLNIEHQNLTIANNSSVFPKRTIVSSSTGITTAVVGGVGANLFGAGLIFGFMPVGIAAAGLAGAAALTVAGIGLAAYGVGYLAKNTINKVKTPSKYNQALQINNYLNNIK